MKKEPVWILTEKYTCGHHETYVTKLLSRKAAENMMDGSCETCHKPLSCGITYPEDQTDNV